MVFTCYGPSLSYNDYKMMNGIVVGVALKKGTLLQWSPFSFQLINYDWI